MFLLLEIALSFGSHEHISIGKSPGQNTENHINPHSLHLSPLIPMPTGRVYGEAKSVAWICWDSRFWRSCMYGVTRTLWRHSFFSNTNFNKTMLQILLLNNILYLLVLVSMEKDVNCVSLYSFSILVTWLTKYGHDYQNWKQPLKEQTWPKPKPRILRETKIRRLEVHL